MVRPSSEFIRAAQPWIGVRVTNMSGVDLSIFTFDYDLTFALLLMNADGRIYHRFGTRGPRDAAGWSSIPALIKLLEGALDTHREYVESGARARPAPRRTIEDSKSWIRRTRKNKPDCVHCHNVGETERENRRGKTVKSDLWVWPTPARVGLAYDVLDQALIEFVAASSAASRAGLRVGDRVLRAGPVIGPARRSCRSIADFQYALNAIAPTGGKLAVDILRDGKEQTLILAVNDGWRRAPVGEIAWRATKWTMLPAPGFGGPRLEAGAKRALGLAPDAFAFRVNYLVTWGENRRFGQAASRAGIRKGDIVASVAGKSDFDSIEHFHAWYRISRNHGETIEVITYRGGKRRIVELKVLE